MYTKRLPVHLTYTDLISLHCTNTDNMARIKNCRPVPKSVVSQGLAGNVQLDPAYQSVQSEVLGHSVRQNLECPSFNEGSAEMSSTEPPQEEVPVASVKRGTTQENAEMYRQQHIVDHQSDNESDHDSDNGSDNEDTNNELDDKSNNESNDEDTIQVYRATFLYIPQSIAVSGQCVEVLTDILAGQILETRSFRD